MKLYGLYYVRWHDAVQPRPEWSSLDELQDMTATKCSSVGWLVAESSDSYVFAPNVSWDENGNIECASGSFTIPQSAIVYSLPIVL